MTALQSVVSEVPESMPLLSMYIDITLDFVYTLQECQTLHPQDDCRDSENAEHEPHAPITNTDLLSSLVSLFVLCSYKYPAPHVLAVVLFRPLTKE